MYSDTLLTTRSCYLPSHVFCHPDISYDTHSDTLLPYIAATKHGVYSDTLIHNMTCILTPYSPYTAAT